MRIITYEAFILSLFLSGRIALKANAEDIEKTHHLRQGNGDLKSTQDPRPIPPTTPEEWTICARYAGMQLPSTSATNFRCVGAGSCIDENEYHYSKVVFESRDVAECSEQCTGIQESQDYLLGMNFFHGYCKCLYDAGHLPTNVPGSIFSRVEYGSGEIDDVLPPHGHTDIFPVCYKYTPGHGGPKCTEHTDCQILRHPGDPRSKWCESGVCVKKKDIGEICGYFDECASGNCFYGRDEGTCTPAIVGNLCYDNEGCQSGSCFEGICQCQEDHDCIPCDTPGSCRIANPERFKCITHDSTTQKICIEEPRPRSPNQASSQPLETAVKK